MRARARRFIGAIAAEHASPPRLFAACVVGAIVGSTPFFGLHLPIAIAIAWALRLNRVAVYGAANVSIPPIAPFLAAGCIEVGTRILHHHGAAMHAGALRGASPWKLAGDVFVAWVVGAPFVGGAIGVVIGALVYGAARRRSEQKDDPFARAAEETFARFAREKPWIRHYVRWKIRLDPVYRAITAQLPDRVYLVELGTGLGILPIIATLLGSHRRALGVDWDEPKLAAARNAAGELPIVIERADVRTYEPPPCDAIAIVDVLHYFDEATQRAVLARAVKALATGGVLFVRDGEGGREGSAWTRAIERLAVRLGWNRSDDRPRFRPISALVADLEGLGMSCTIERTAGPLHPGNVLVRAVKS